MSVIDDVDAAMRRAAAAGAKSLDETITSELARLALAYPWLSSSDRAYVSRDGRGETIVVPLYDAPDPKLRAARLEAAQNAATLAATQATEAAQAARLLEVEVSAVIAEATSDALVVES